MLFCQTPLINPQKTLVFWQKRKCPHKIYIVFYRQPVPNAISGTQLSGAAHRLLVNTLQIKQTKERANSGQILQRQPIAEVVGILRRPTKGQPSGPPGYEDGFSSTSSSQEKQGWDFSSPLYQAISSSSSHPPFTANGFSTQEKGTQYRSAGPAIPQGIGFLGRGNGQVHQQSFRASQTTVRRPNSNTPPFQPYTWIGRDGDGSIEPNAINQGQYGRFASPEKRVIGRGRGISPRRDSSSR